jgi:hypothetical protein
LEVVLLLECQSLALLLLLTLDQILQLLLLQHLLLHVRIDFLRNNR